MNLDHWQFELELRLQLLYLRIFIHIQLSVFWFGLVWVMLGLSPILLDGRVTDRAHHSLVPRATTCLEVGQVRYIPSTMQHCSIPCSAAESLMGP